MRDVREREAIRRLRNGQAAQQHAVEGIFQLAGPKSSLYGPNAILDALSDDHWDWGA